MPRVMQCLQFDEATATCTAQAWVDQPTVFPPLSVEDGLLIGGKIVLLWAICFGLKITARFIWRG